jgi:hypothetical protein
MPHIRSSSLPGLLARAGLALALAAAGQAVFMPAASAANLTVTSTADVATNFGACGNTALTTSSGSLREAVCAANNAGATSSTITVAAGTYHLANGELQMGKVSGSNITLNGAGAASTIIDADGLSRVFNLDPNLVGGVITSISGVTITDGADSIFGGAGIIGGATAMPTGDTLTISNSTISNNRASGGSNTGGGVAFAGGNLTVTNSTISNNSSNGAQGSGLWYRAEGTASGEGLTISGTTFSGNNVSTSSVRVGGALSVEIQRASPANFNVSNSRFLNNTVTATATGTPVGGAIWAPSGVLNVTESTFTGNSVTGGVSPAGGAIMVSGATATLQHNRFTGNVGASGQALSVSAGSVNAANNWWGCNAGPGTAGCDTVAGTATVSPRLVLSATASPSTVVGPNATSTITAALTTNSLGSAVAASSLDAFAGLPVGWSDPLPSGATVAAASTNLSSGSASTTYNSQATSGPGHVIATLDNGSATATVTVNRTPAITSANTAAFTVGTAGSFTVTTTGYPAPAIGRTGTLPAGMTFVDNGNGTATLSGTPTAGGSFPLSLTASNGVNPNATQTLTVTVSQAPAFTSATSTTFTVGTAGSFTVTTTGYPTPSIGRTGTLPTGLSFVDNGNGTATLSGTPAAGTGGAYSLNLTASNGVNPNGTQTLTVNVNQAPAITTNPSNQSVNPGASVSFTAAASGFPAPTVQWQRSVGGGSFTNIAGATSPTYTFTAAAGDNGNQYRAVFTNSVSSATSTAATLTVSSAPTISSANSTSFAVGTAGSFTVTTSGFPNPTLTTTGTLPAWLSFTDNGDGTGTLAGTPPAGSGGSYNFTINADNGTAPSDSQAFTLTVTESPTITSADSASFQAGTAGNFLVTTSAGFPVATTLSKTGTLPSGVTFTDNGNGTATLAGTPAAGTAGSYPITITASNGASPNGTQSFTLTVVESPVITSADHATFVVGTAGSFSVTTSGAAGTTVSYTGTLPSGVSFTPSGTGATIAGTPAANTGGTYPITITASDGVTPDSTQNFTLTVNQPPVITSADHDSFSLGVAGSFTVTTAPGVPASTVITKTGSLPAGVSFTDNGDGTATIAGTPTAAGTFAITITASNGVAPDGTQAFTLTVNQAPGITSADHVTFEVGTAGSFTVTTSPAADTVTSTGTLPSGVSFTDNGDGTATLAGTPAAGTGGVYNLTLKATNATGFSTQAFTLTVNELANITSADHTTFTIGSAGSFTVTTAAGHPTATTITKTGTLPVGVSFTDNGDGTATLAGTPAAGADGSYPLTISATNAAGVDQQSFTLTVVPANASPVITSDDHATFEFGTAGTFTVTTTAGYPTATTITKTGALPAGVSFTDNGDGTATIAGTPTAAGSFPITITAGNGASTDATQSFTLTVTKLPVITSGNATTFAIGTAKTFTVTTAAGYPTATSLSQTGALPSGISFTDNGDGTASLSGTAAAGTTGSYPLTITAGNSAGSTQQAFTLTVQPANSSPVITSADNTTFRMGTAGSFTVTTTAGFPTATTITRTGTALPAGVTFTDNGDGTATLAGTATVAGVFTFTITASNGATANATQSFTLTVTKPPVITSANTVTFTSDLAGQSFTVTTTAGYPTATTITKTGTLPAGMTFTDNGNGTATLAGTPSVAASANYPLVITASNGISPNATQNFTLKVTKVAAVALPSSKPKPAGKLGGVPSKVYVNQVITVTGAGYKPGAPIELGWYYSSSGKATKLTVLARSFANAAGTFSITLTVPNNTGSKTMMSAGLGSDGKARYLSAETVVNPPLGTSTGTTTPIAGASTGGGTSTGGGGGLANTGLATNQRVSAASAGALALTGLALMVFSRRRREQK